MARHRSVARTPSFAMACHQMCPPGTCPQPPSNAPLGGVPLGCASALRGCALVTRDFTVYPQFQSSAAKSHQFVAIPLS